MTLWMEVDLKNKELPTGRMATTASELSRICGVERSVVSNAIRQAKRRGTNRSKYVRVEIEEDIDD